MVRVDEAAKCLVSSSSIAMSGGYQVWARKVGAKPAARLFDGVASAATVTDPGPVASAKPVQHRLDGRNATSPNVEPSPAGRQGREIARGERYCGARRLTRSGDDPAPVVGLRQHNVLCGSHPRHRLR
jgi:hypothetical protein